MKKEKIEFDLDIFVKELSKFNMNFPAKENPSFRLRGSNVKSNLALPDYGLDSNINYNNLIYWKAYIGSLNKEKFIDLLSDRLMDCEFSWNCEEATTTTIASLRRPSSENIRKQLQRLKKFKADRSQVEVDKALDALGRATENENDNIFGRIVEAAEAGATNGEICGKLRDEMGFGYPLVAA